MTFILRRLRELAPDGDPGVKGPMSNGAYGEPLDINTVSSSTEKSKRLSLCISIIQNGLRERVLHSLVKKCRDTFKQVYGGDICHIHKQNIIKAMGYTNQAKMLKYIANS